MKGEKSVQGQPAVPEDSPKREEVTIKFGKGLVGEPFISKAGKELVEIKIPNRDARDHRPWGVLCGIAENGSRESVWRRGYG